MNEAKPTLAALRDEIDRVDDSLVDLLARRTELVAKVGALKNASGGTVLRPGREASILRRCMARADSRMEAGTVVRIWREIVSAAVRQQGPFSLAVSLPEGEPGCWMAARDHFGAMTPIRGLPGPAAVIGAVADGADTAGVIPAPRPDDPEPWWPRLMHDRAPRLIARLPFLIPSGPVRSRSNSPAALPSDGCSEAVMVASAAPEASGDDTTFIALDCPPGMGRSRIQAALGSAGLSAIQTCLAREAGEHADAWLVEVDGFHEPDTIRPALGAALGSETGGDRVGIYVIGAAARPMTDRPKGETP